ncbi:phage tail protein [Serratia bockelmannii]|uniref:phage tail protein n=1 Tax=Serratia bockelmannii TaxID=2703793 RepID=UPI003FA758F0
MANLPETPQWEDGVYQIEVSDPVLGGPDGISNRQAKQLASRTSYLKQKVEKGGTDLAAHIAAADPHTQYAPKASPTFTGTPTAPTPAANDNSKKLVTTEFVARAIAALAGTAPETLDTLKELADALGNDPNFATTVLNKLAEKLAKDQNGADIPDPALFVQNLGFGDTISKAAGAMQKGSNGSDISNVTSFLNNLGITFTVGSGYIILKVGPFILACGNANGSTTSDGNLNVTLPTAFPNTVMYSNATQANSSYAGDTTPIIYSAYAIGSGPITAAGFAVRNTKTGAALTNTSVAARYFVVGF